MIILTTNWLDGIDLNQVITVLNTLFDWIITGLTTLLESISTWFNYVSDAIGRLNSYVSGFGSIIQSVFNVIPSVYKDVVILAITLTIVFIYYKRGA